ncbi:MAG: hypothetical protein LHW64_12170 [Candidatus Cloacimonetes bacterium]|jgi:hypothetical protein|nr:hypothetical protein [Candidatus Cloacimonadota bacterium]MDY0230837.1 hypothetical protein [Candidatus Cloacimonadaceae bacterium]
MLFTDLVHAVHPHLMKDADVPAFMRNLIQMLCDIPEEDWSTKKDPSSEQSNKDSSLRKFYTKGPTKKLAKSMLGRLTRDNFIDSIYHDDHFNDRTDVVLESLVEDMQPFSDDVEKDNVGEVLFNLLKQSLEFIVNPELENDRKLSSARTGSQKAKGIFGPGLIEDCRYVCSMPGCGKHLQIVNDKNHAVDNYEVASIKSGKASPYENLIAMCHDCFQNYVFNHTKAVEKDLQTIKTLQSDARSSRRTLDEVAIEKGITHVIDNLSRSKPGQLLALNYDAVSVSEKIDEGLHSFLLYEVKGHVARYYLFIEKTMQDLVRRKQFSDDLLRAQIKESYRKLAEKKNSPESIYSALSERLRQITKQDIRFCSIVISYFIQSCEVFNATTK